MEQLARQATLIRLREILIITPKSPRQSAYCERVIGSIHRECTNHLLAPHQFLEDCITATTALLEVVVLYDVGDSLHSRSVFSG